jgi:hypothetical protein
MAPIGTERSFVEIARSITDGLMQKLLNSQSSMTLA